MTQMRIARSQSGKASVVKGPALRIFFAGRTERWLGARCVGSDIRGGAGDVSAHEGSFSGAEGPAAADPLTLQAWKLTLVVRLVINCQLGVLGPVGLTIRAGQFAPTGGHRGWLGRPLEGRRIQRPCSQTMGLAAAGGVTRGRERTTLTIA